MVSSSERGVNIPSENEVFLIGCGRDIGTIAVMKGGKIRPVASVDHAGKRFTETPVSQFLTGSERNAGQQFGNIVRGLGLDLGKLNIYNPEISKGIVPNGLLEEGDFLDPSEYASLATNYRQGTGQALYTPAYTQVTGPGTPPEDTFPVGSPAYEQQQAGTLGQPLTQEFIQDYTARNPRYARESEPFTVGDIPDELPAEDVNAAMQSQNANVAAAETAAAPEGFVPTNELQSRVVTTPGGLVANENFVNAAFKAFHGRDANAQELKTFAGQTVDQARGAIMAGSPILQRQQASPAAPAVPAEPAVPGTITPETTLAEVEQQGGILGSLQNFISNLFTGKSAAREEAFQQAGGPAANNRIADIQQEMADKRTFYAQQKEKILNRQAPTGIIGADLRDLERTEAIVMNSLAMSEAVAQGQYDRASELAQQSANDFAEYAQLEMQVMLQQLEWDREDKQRLEQRMLDNIDFERSLALEGYAKIRDPKDLEWLTEDRIVRMPGGDIYLKPIGAGMSSAGVSSLPSGAASSSAGTIAEAIKQIESNGNYQARGASGEYGAYQYMPGTWQQWSREYAQANGIQQTLDVTSPQNQDAVANWKIQQWLNQGYGPQQIASMWNSGSPEWQGKVGTNSQGVPYNVPQYVERFTQALGSMAGSGMQEWQDFTDQEKRKLEAQGLANATRQEQLDYLYGKDSADLPSKQEVISQIQELSSQYSREEIEDFIWQIGINPSSWDVWEALNNAYGV